MAFRLLACSAALAVLMPGAAPASEETLTTVVRGPYGSLPAWLSFEGTLHEPPYRARIDISDLRLDQSGDQAVMVHRVRMGSAKMCRRIYTAEPQLAYNPEPAIRNCRREAVAGAEPQMNSAIDAARRGERVAYLGMAPAGS
ncbi:hypothetical protein [Novosphingobium sp. KA1]|uniref:hypothetical protein n=1 Tax=Novosphingobium sp. (strain KA1) TaxID=164608 RepID=UPI001A8FB426|nr:hypothetical protein [Novosphingobium sp. KA1]QSR16147.1 hypothetical protein CA833_02860 [Novosphingobium sp. KA1]